MLHSTEKLSQTFFLALLKNQKGKIWSHKWIRLRFLFTHLSFQEEKKNICIVQKVSLGAIIVAIFDLLCLNLTRMCVCDTYSSDTNKWQNVTIEPLAANGFQFLTVTEVSVWFFCGFPGLLLLICTFEPLLLCEQQQETKAPHYISSPSTASFYLSMVLFLFYDVYFYHNTWMLWLCQEFTFFSPYHHV